MTNILLIGLIFISIYAYVDHYRKWTHHRRSETKQADKTTVDGLPQCQATLLLGSRIYSCTRGRHPENTRHMSTLNDTGGRILQTIWWDDKKIVWAGPNE